MNVGFVGLGIMGKPMSINVQKAGHQVYAFDFHIENAKELVELGGVACANGKEVAEKSDVVITMLPNSPHVESALFAENGIAEGLTAGKCVIDMSSIAPLASRDFAKRLEELGVDFLDAPVSGGEPKAIDGTIAVMVGGKQDVFDKYEDLLKTMASTVTLVGEVGAGNITKLANQMIVAINIAGISEAYSLAKKAGVDPARVYEAIRSGLAGSTVMDQKSRSPRRSSTVTSPPASASSSTSRTSRTSWTPRIRSTCPLRSPRSLWRSCSLSRPTATRRTTTPVSPSGTRWSTT